MGEFLLLVAHGSRDARHARTVRALTRRIRSTRPGLPVSTAFLDFDSPAVPQELERLARHGARRVVVQPLLLTRAFHASVDLPGVLRQAPPSLAVRQAGVLGPDPLLTAALERRLREAGLGPQGRTATGVVLAAAGTTDPGAAAGIAGIARRWQHTGWCAVRPAFASGGVFPRTEDVVRALRAEGVERIAVAPYVLAPGRLPDRIAAGAAAAGADVLGAVLGAAPELARLVLLRYDAARADALALTG
ncbi:sirohydrochlorin chelatase [Streptomyces sp. NBC_00091]|uniref:sirohydrochlorin chelatase n=1 Tax=Streptomyces sp. NBC_00091 TaxID=2975648 RepID=UPI002258A09C|nr:CbiX/SirB N-terminal domain-containing protein [Streptomyces sp. NBC_00091]MCX5381062.1 sirohydrochlorin chelatase [Streptomyces sp. NBC_00091]